MKKDNMNPTQKEIHAIACQYGALNHGEIFMEYYNGDKLTVKNVAEQLREEEREQATFDWNPVQQNNNILDTETDDKAILIYAQQNLTHGEAAGQFFRACLNDSNIELAKSLEPIYNHEGWDS